MILRRQKLPSILSTLINPGTVKSTKMHILASKRISNWPSMSGQRRRKLRPSSSTLSTATFSLGLTLSSRIYHPLSWQVLWSVSTLPCSSAPSVQFTAGASWLWQRLLLWPSPSSQLSVCSTTAGTIPPPSTRGCHSWSSVSVLSMPSLCAMLWTRHHLITLHMRGYMKLYRMRDLQ